MPSAEATFNNIQRRIGTQGSIQFFLDHADDEENFLELVARTAKAASSNAFLAGVFMALEYPQYVRAMVEGLPVDLADTVTLVRQLVADNPIDDPPVPRPTLGGGRFA